MANKLGGGTRAHSGWGLARGRASLCQLSAKSAAECGARKGPGCGNSRPEVPKASAAALKELSNVAISDLTGYWEAPQGPVARKLKVAVDVDEVLGRFLVSLNMYCKEEHGMDYNVEDYWIYEFAKIWGCSGDVSNNIVHDFFKSPHFRKGIPVMPGAFETLYELTNWCELMVVTSRQHLIEDETMEWITDHFPGIFQSVHFGNHFARQGDSRKKSAICKDIGADVLIDDNPSYAIDCASNGVEVILYNWHNQYPWSTLPRGEESRKIHQVSNWREVKSALMCIKEYNDCCESRTI